MREVHYESMEACIPKERVTMKAGREQAMQPEDLTRLFVVRANAGDAEGLAELYEPTAVVAYPPGSVTVGREAIRALYEQMLSAMSHFTQEASLPTLRNGDLAVSVRDVRNR